VDLEADGRGKSRGALTLESFISTEEVELFGSLSLALSLLFYLLLWIAL